MHRQTSYSIAPTASDLKGSEFKFVVRSPVTGLLSVNVDPGTPSSGILVEVETDGAVQYGRYMTEGEQIRMLAGGNIAFNDAVTNDASGKAVVVAGNAQQAARCLRTGDAADGVYVELLKQSVRGVFRGTSTLIAGSKAIAPGAFAIPAGAVIHATRKGVPATAIGDLTVSARTVGVMGVATFTVDARLAAAGTVVAADVSDFDWSIEY